MHSRPHMRVNNRSVRDCINFLNCLYTAIAPLFILSRHYSVSHLSHPMLHKPRRPISNDIAGARNDSALFFDRFHVDRPQFGGQSPTESRVAREDGARSNDQAKTTPSPGWLSRCLAPLCSYTTGRTPAATGAASLTAKLSS